MNILIVDDEFYIVQGIVKNTNWNNLGIDKVSVAYSMKQAQDIFLNQQVEILLSDIEMPRGTGLELIEWAQDNGYSPVSLLLTGHKRFDYAQKAVQMQCIDYILKPVEISILEAQILRAVKKVQENALQNNANKIAESWNAKKEHIIESSWRELFTNSTPLTDEQMQKSFEGIDISFDYANDSFYLILINIHPIKNSEASDSDIPIGTIQTIIQERFYSEKRPPLIKISSNTLVILCQAEAFKSFEDCYAACSTLLSDLLLSTSCKYNIYPGDCVAINHIREAYQILCKFKDNILPNDSIVLPVDASASSVSLNLKTIDSSNISLDQWLEWLLQLNSGKIIDDINLSLDYKAAYYPISLIKTIYLGIMKTIFSALESKQISANEMFPKLVSHADFIQEASSRDTFMQWINALLNNTEELLSAENNSDSIIDSVKKIVKDKISSFELNRSFIAAQIHLNPDYLSYLFHKEAGQSLSNYIMNERIVLAKRLLKTTNKTLQDISEMTGFSNGSYFHKQFKRLTGMTPHQYRSS